MSVKIYDTMTTATSNFPLAYAEKINIVKEDGSEADIQTLYNNGELGGGDTSLTVTEAEYLALPEEQKLNNSYYLYDIGVHYKNGVAYSRKKPIQLTMEEYKALGEVDPDQEYIVSADEQGILLGASDISYSNAVSNLPCTTVQGAIDKIDGKVEELNDSLVDITCVKFEKLTELTTVQSYTNQTVKDITSFKALVAYLIEAEDNVCLSSLIIPVELFKTLGTDNIGAMVCYTDTSTSGAISFRLKYVNDTTIKCYVSNPGYRGILYGM